MRDHPVATASQHEQELAALDLIEHPTVKAAYRTVAGTWLGRAKASDAMRPSTATHNPRTRHAARDVPGLCLEEGRTPPVSPAR